MAKKKTPHPKAKSWQLAVSEEVCEAKNPHHLGQAAAHLGPFKYQTEAEALSNQFTYTHHKEDWAISKELALKLTSQTAKRFNKERHLFKGAPRFQHVLKAIRRVQRAADSLCAGLNSLDDISRHELQFYKPISLNAEQLRQIKKIAAKAQVAALPRATNDKSSPVKVGWTDRTKALAELTEFTLQRLQHQRTQANRSIEDKGGVNVYRENVGNPKWGLVFDCITLFEAFRPNELQGSPGTAFYNFVLDVFEYATGHPGDGKHGKLDDRIKDVVAAHSKLISLEAKIEAVSNETLLLEQQKDPTKAEKARLNDLTGQLSQLFGLKNEVAEKLWPHTRLAAPLTPSAVTGGEPAPTGAGSPRA